MRKARHQVHSEVSEPDIPLTFGMVTKSIASHKKNGQAFPDLVTCSAEVDMRKTQGVLYALRLYAVFFNTSKVVTFMRKRFYDTVAL
jgi:hypothetical protein